MDCLHCGAPIGMLRKLSDTEFCSTEHRRQYESARERALLARLASGEARIEKSRALWMARRTAAAPPPDPMPAPLAPCMPEPDAGDLAFLTFAALAPSTGARSKPSLPVRLPTAAHLFGFASDLPWPCQDLRLQTCPPIAMTGQGRQYLEATVRVLGNWKPKIVAGTSAHA